MFSTTAKRLVAATFAGGIVALSPVLAPAANAVPGVDEPCSYAAPVTTVTTLALNPSSPTRNQAFGATATVTASEGLPPTGNVRFSYNGDSVIVPLSPSGGSTSTATTASDAFVATVAGPVSADYFGVCAAGGGGTVIGSSGDVLGIEAFGGNGGGTGTGTGNGGSGAVGGISGGTTSGGGTVGGLAATGMDSQTELYALLGAGMVAVGGLTLVVRRRRVEA